MAGKAAVPQFGSWDAENVGYTIFFDKVRENRPAPVPPAPAAPKGRDDYEFDPYEHYENLSRNATSRPASSHGHVHPAPPAQYYENPGRNAPSRPPSSHGGGHGHPAPQQHHAGQHGYHRRNGSNGSSAASEVSSRASKFSPPRPYQPRYGNDSNNGSYYQPQQQQHAAAPRPRHHQHATPRVAAPSPPHHAPPPAHEQRPSQGAPQARAAKAPPAVPKFGVWEEQNATTAAQGFTVQFETLKRNREVKKVAAPDVPPPRQQLSPERAAPTWGQPQRKPKKSFLSKVYGCLFPVVRQ